MHGRYEFPHNIDHGKTMVKCAHPIVETHEMMDAQRSRVPTVNCDCTDEISTQKPHEKMSSKSPFAHKTPYYFHSYYDVLFFFTGQCVLLQTNR